MIWLAQCFTLRQRTCLSQRAELQWYIQALLISPFSLPDPTRRLPAFSILHWQRAWNRLSKKMPEARVPKAFIVLPNFHSSFYLTNRFQVAVRLFSNRSQMTSKCVRTKKWLTRRSRVCHWCSYHILTSSVIYYWTDRTHGNMESICLI